MRTFVANDVALLHQLRGVLERGCAWQPCVLERPKERYFERTDATGQLSCGCNRIQAGFAGNRFSFISWGHCDSRDGQAIRQSKTLAAAPCTGTLPFSADRLGLRKLCAFSGAVLARDCCRLLARVEKTDCPSTRDHGPGQASRRQNRGGILLLNWLRAADRRK